MKKLNSKILIGIAFLMAFLINQFSYAQNNIVINEVMVNPSTSQGIIGTLDPNGQWYYGSEYIEIYNKSCSETIDISGWMLGTNSIATGTPPNCSRNAGCICFPPGTTIPPFGHIVIGTQLSCTDAASVDIKLETFVPQSQMTSNNDCSVWGKYQYIAFPYEFNAPSSRPTYFVLGNYDGWLALYDNAGTPMDAIFWPSDQNEINSDVDSYDQDVQVPTGAPYQGTLKSVKKIYQSTPSIVAWMGKNASKGKVFMRTSDGAATWTEGTPSINNATGGATGNCNGGTCASGGAPNATAGPITQPTCGQTNGTAEVTTTGDYDYTWNKDGSPYGTNTKKLTGLSAGTYTVTVNNKPATLCNKVFTFDVQNSGAPVPTITPTDGTCGLPNGSASASATGGDGNYTYTWGGVASGKTGDNVTGLAAGSITVTVKDGLGCQGSANATIGTTPVITGVTFSSTPDFCGQANGTATAETMTGGTGAMTAWSWNKGTATTSKTNTGIEYGPVSCTVTDEKGCTYTGTTNIGGTPGPRPTISVEQPDHCSLGIGIIKVNEIYPTYAWNGGQIDQRITNLATNTYTVTVTDNNNCTGTATINVPNVPGPTANFTIEPKYAFAGDEIAFISTNTGISSWSWTFGDGGTSTESGTTHHTYAETATYPVILNITDTYGCSSTYTDSVSIVKLTIPNIITPNGDGQNDLFRIIGLEQVPNKLLKIYNRWGRKVFESKDYLNNWDAAGVSDGTYFYTLWVEELQKEYHGTITVLKQ